MKFIKTHIIFFLAVIGFLTSVTLEAKNSFEATSFLIESEIEESFDEEIESCRYFNDISIKKSNSGGNAVIVSTQLFFNNDCFNFSNIFQLKSNLLTNKVAYFILYCCLKVNC